MLNNQKPTKTIFVPNGSLSVHSVFLTIQGEGPYSGRRAVFIRLEGCNLQCPQCDTDYTSNKISLSPSLIFSAIHAKLPARAKNLVVITGGEPFRQNLLPLIRTLLGQGYLVQVETNGTLYQELPYSDPRLTIVCSPKTGTINQFLLPHIKALKYVLSANDIMEDGLPSKALGHLAKPFLARPPKNFRGTIYIQPADEKDMFKNADNIEAAVKSTLEFGYTLCLQTHKIIGVE